MDLAQKVGVSLVTIQLWEREISKPTEKNKKELERVIAELQQQQKGDR